MEENTDVDTDLLLGGWYRFSRYELHDGYIRPVESAELESYDPWVTYHHAWEHTSEKKTPLVQLLDLYRDLGYPATEVDLGEEGQARILQWCREYGLLGILLHTVNTVVLHPPVKLPYYSVKGLPKTITRSTYFKTSSGWLHQQDSILSGDSEEQYTLSTTIGEAALDRKTLSDYWGLFFPKVNPRDYYYYVPSETPGWKERFWRAYAEPVDEFLKALGILHRAIERTAYIVEDDSNWHDSKTEVFNEGMNTLHGLTDGVSPVLVPQGNKFEQRWSSPSLLASLAMMALQDSVGVRHVRRCVCGRLFVTSKALYCSPKCATAERKRILRLKHLITLKRHLERQPPEKIAKEVSSTTTKVKGWISDATKVWKLKGKGLSTQQISDKTGLEKSVVEIWMREMKKAKKSVPESN